MYEFPSPAPVAAQIRVRSGIVEIVAEQRDTVTVDIEPETGSEGAREAAERTRVELRDGRLLVDSPEPTGWLIRRAPRIRVHIRLPIDSSIHLRTASADLTAHGRYASAVVNTASGDVYLEQVTGDVSANTASGDVRFAEVGGHLRVNAASGDLAAQQVDGDVTATSASGAITLEQVGAGVSATTASGDIHIGTARRGEIRINSASGDVVVGVAAGTGVWLDLSTLSGATRSDLDVAGDTSLVARQDLTVRVKTMSGDIDIRRVTAPATA